jgi:hypothetical protein
MNSNKYVSIFATRMIPVLKKLGASGNMFLTRPHCMLRIKK